MELNTSYWEAPSLMCVTTILLSMVKTKSLMSLEKILCYGIKDWDILEISAFKHYKVKLWFKVCLITN